MSIRHPPPILKAGNSPFLTKRYAVVGCKRKNFETSVIVRTLLPAAICPYPLPRYELGLSSISLRLGTPQSHRHS